MNSKRYKSGQLNTGDTEKAALSLLKVFQWFFIGVRLELNDDLYEETE